MKSLKEISEEIKNILSLKIGHRKIYNEDVAKALGIKLVTFYAQRNRNNIPYEKIMKFCLREKISFEYLFYGNNQKGNQ